MSAGFAAKLRTGVVSVSLTVERRTEFSAKAVFRRTTSSQAADSNARVANESPGTVSGAPTKIHATPAGSATTIPLASA